MEWLSPNLAPDKHCFFGRLGGASQGRYFSLNLNSRSADNPEHIRQNYQTIAAHYGLDTSRLLRLNQGVSADVVFVDSPSMNQITADGAVTTTKDIILCIGTADCAPVLFADYAHGVIGAAHGGWRGAFKGVIENTLNLMLRHGAQVDSIAAAIGPCIQQPSFEMGAEVRTQFMTQSAANAAYFIPAPRAEHYLFDLSGYIRDKLLHLGVNNVINSGIDTYTDAANWYSYRRDTHQGLITSPHDFPVELSTIIL